MDYEWDPAKDWANQSKHGVAFADAVIALEDTLALTRLEANGHEELRYVSIGMHGQGRLLVTVFTTRKERLGIISSRRATRAERLQYEQE